jgi:5-methylcytosine-specific restriction enzyme B
MREPGRAEPLYEVLERWVQDCLRGDGSLLEPDRAVWTEANLAAMKHIWIDNPDESDRDFATKAADELAGQPREVKLLAAEIRTVQLFPMAEVAATSKRKEIDELLAAGEIEVRYPGDVTAALDHGLAKYGMAKVHKYWHLCLIIDRVLAFKRLPVSEREAVLGDPWAWKRFVRDNQLQRVGSQENMLFHIAHPESFEPIPSGADKQSIATALGQYADGETDQDRALLAIHRALIDERGGWVNLWDEDVRALWHPDAKAQIAADEQEVLWQQDWSSWLVDHYRAAGGAPSVPVETQLPERTRARLEELGRTGDVDAWLSSLRGDVESLSNLWQGSHSRTHRSVVRDSPDPANAARALSEAFLAPGDDEEAAAKIRRLESLTSKLSYAVGPSLLASNVWHMQDPTIPPLWRSIETPLAARGWYDPPSDPVAHYLSYTELLAGFGVDVTFLCPALNTLSDERRGLPGVHPSLFERCAAVANGQPANLLPVIADLEVLAGYLQRELGLGDQVNIARSRTKKAHGAWVELRDRGESLLRLWVDADGLVLARPADGASRPTDLGGFQDERGVPVPTDDEAAWWGQRLSPNEAGDRGRLLAAAGRLLGETASPGPLEDLFASFLSAGETSFRQEESEREVLAGFLTVEALAEPDLNGLRQIINTSRYGNPGPMAALNTSFSEAADRGELDRIGAVFAELCHGEGDLAERIDVALASGIRGLGQSVIVKLLAITHPDRIIPVFPLTGDLGKLPMLEVLGLPSPSSSLSAGQRQVAANDALLNEVEPLTENLAQARDFLYFALEQARTDELGDDDSEDRLANVVSECFVPRAWVDDAVELLRERNQLIFYGPPGTGKTYVALKLAEALAPDAARRKLVQFHPAYSYEDFFEGYRPRPGEGGLSYVLVPGPLKQMAEAARSNPGVDHILVVDEINRANLPKVFGELLFLLEYRDRTATTMYGGEDFGLPANLFIIATMNTADRSIALVDAALRRRFHFMPFYPDRAPFDRTLRAWLSEHGEPRWIAELLDHVNAELRDRFGGHLQIGPSHFMKRGISAKLERVWRYTIEPLLEEQLFGDPQAVAGLRFEAVRRRFGPAAVAAADVVDVDGDGNPLTSEPPGSYDAIPGDVFCDEGTL